MLVQLVEIVMSTFSSHALQDVYIFLSWATCSNTNDHMSEHLATPFIEYIDTMCAHAYLDIVISI